MKCQECSLAKFGMGHDDPSLFVNAQCFKPLVYVIWRGLWALFFFSMLMLDVYYNLDFGFKYLTYLTNLTYIFQTTTLIVDFVVVLYVYNERPDIRDGKSTEMEWYIKVLWVMCNVANTCSLAVTIGYYWFLIPPSFSHGSINTHLLNSVHSILNILFTGKPVQILHFYQPIIYGTFYVTFSIVYHVLGADPIYPPLDWDDPVRTGLLTGVAMVIAIPALHIFIFYSLYTLRTYMSGCCCNSRVGPEPNSQSSSIAFIA